MNGSLDDEQTLVRESARAWLHDHYDFRSRGASIHRDGGSPEVWRAFADMGWLGVGLPEEVGGVGMGPVEAGLLMQAFGRHLVVEPWHACVWQAGRLLALGGSAQQCARWLPALAAGENRLAVAHDEPGHALPWEPRRTTAHRDGKGWRLEGRKRQILSGPGAVRWIVSAVASDDGRTLLFLVDPLDDHLDIDGYDTVPGGRACDAVFDEVRVSDSALIGEPHADASSLLNRILAEGIVATGWEATGAMQSALEQTAAYTRQRRQFGQSLAEFQVVQHRLAEMSVHCQEAQAACELATMMLIGESSEPIDAAGLVKDKVGRACRYAAQEAVQLHGAMGVCEELPIAAIFRLLTSLDRLHAGPAAHAVFRGRALLESGAFACSRTLPERPA